VQAPAPDPSTETKSAPAEEPEPRVVEMSVQLGAQEDVDALRGDEDATKAALQSGLAATLGLPEDDVVIVSVRWGYQARSTGGGRLLLHGAPVAAISVEFYVKAASAETLEALEELEAEPSNTLGEELGSRLQESFPDVTVHGLALRTSPGSTGELSTPESKEAAPDPAPVDANLLEDSLPVEAEDVDETQSDSGALFAAMALVFLGA
jgi:hypothetical protein